ncbi:MAG: ferrous iron transport protein A [Candidatus Bathyarchaeota archaeon]|nr:ferrous iron transport protein A [Candidatus Termiticorpusculum sp.]
MGLTPGTKIRVVEVAPMDGPVEVAVRGSKLALGQDIACNVFVEARTNCRLKRRITHNVIQYTY